MFKKIKILLMLLFLAPVLSLGFLGEKSQKSGLLPRNLSQNATESEVFIDYWKEDFRKDDNGEIISICDITLASYKEMYGKYVLLSDVARSEVDVTPDYEEGYTIKDSIKELVTHYESDTKADNKKAKLNHSSTIIIIVVVAVFGMSVICVFFALKNGNIIQ